MKFFYFNSDDDTILMNGKCLESAGNVYYSGNQVSLWDYSGVDGQKWVMDENELISEQNDNLQIKFELQNKKIKVENKNKGNLTIGIPNSEQMDSVDSVENRLVYSGKDAKFETIIEAIDGGMRQVINIKDATAPDFYDFPVELETGEKLVINNVGSVVVIRPKSPKELEIDRN